MKTPAHADRLITPMMVVVGLFFLTVPFWIVKVGLYPYIGIEILIWAIYALGFNLLLGTAGLPSFGHGAFFGIGAYAFGLTQLNVSGNLWISLLGGVLAASLAGLFVAAFVARRRGIYFALLTIAFGEVFWFIAMKARHITGGEDGLLPIVRPPVDLGFASFSLADNTALYYFVFAIFMLTVVGLWRLTHSPFGRVLSAIRQSETRAAHLGYRVVLFKMLVLIISAAFSGLAGSLFAMAQGGAFPEVMSLRYSGFIIMMVLVGGGFVSFWGPVIGVIVFLLARDILGAVTITWMMWFGMLFVCVILFKPEGLAGIMQDLRDRFTKRPAPETALERAP
jgi:branched-chain amino acid transport system permease protein